MKKTLLFAFSAMLANAYAQKRTEHTDPGHLTCKNNQHYEAYCRTHGIDMVNNPDAIAYENELRDIAANLETRERADGTRAVVYIVPVVFHIVHAGGPENISDAQVMDALNILNRDFRKLNADTSVVVPAFAGIVADVEVEFRLAQKDALGNCVSGITRTFSSTTFDGDRGMVDAVNMNLNGSTSTSNTRFPRNMYLNIWICRYADGAAGYTNTPLGASFGPSKYDGIWIQYNYFGSIGTGSVTTSRALTHEVGHWFNLSHVWGNTNNPGVSCGDDGVTDTPETEGWTTCNLSGASCGNVIDNVQNYMEYSYCCRMFTEGQRTRMRAALNSSVSSRSNLWTNTNLTATGVIGTSVLCASDFTSDETLICAGDSITFTDLTYHGVTVRNWNFPSGIPSTSTDVNPVITYNTPGQFNVDVTSGNGTSSLNTSKSNYITVLDPVGAPAPFSEDFEATASIPDAEWYISNSDGMQPWALYTGAGSSGNHCIKLDNFSFNGSGAKDVFFSQTFDLSGFTSAELRFKYAYKQRNAADNEKLKVYVSSNCGQTWSLRKQIAGSTLSDNTVATAAFTPGAADWRSFEVTNIVSSFLVQGFRFKIEFESDNGNNVYIDDINLDVSTGVNDIEGEVLSLSVYPNPVNSQATIEYTLPSAENVEIKLTDILGKTIAVLEKGQKPSGAHSLKLATSQVPAKGIYFITIQAGNATQTKKVVMN